MTKEEREKVIDALKISAPIHALTEEEFNDYIQTLNKAMDWLEQEPKTGHWINGDCKGGNCSICGEYYAFYPESGDFNYCPNCGAKMIEPQEMENP